MIKAFRLFIALLLFGLVVTIPVNIAARPMQLTTALLSPTACPAAGCAAGQRFNARVEFSVNPVYTAGPNTQICIYTSLEGANAWADLAVFDISNSLIYTSGYIPSVCEDITDNLLLGGAYAKFESPSSQQFDFATRINSISIAPGSLKVSIYQLNAAGDTWNKTEGPTDLSLNVAAAASPAYVSPDASTCTGNSPCYLNSGDDLAGGIGTGLKDAVDASPVNGAINILGNYSIKNNSVSLTNPQTIQGMNDSSLTYSGIVCTNSMLTITSGVIIKTLNINDGGCTSPSRDLVAINSPLDVKLLNNDLVNGKDAVAILDNTGNVSLRFNQITGNSGYGILRNAGAASGIVKAVANNIYNNRNGFQVECNNKGEMNHNFWGSGINPNAAIRQCTYTPGKQLGAAILINMAAPGVSAQEKSLSATKTSIPEFDNLISIDGTPGTNLIIANHGNGRNDNIPFLGAGTEDITACNHFFDVFISDENAIIPTSLSLYFKYDLNQACETAIESTSYCGSFDPAEYPLFWYDPQNSITEGWDTTGQIPAGEGATGVTGQTTSCDTANKEISVSIDSNPSHRPNLISDLNYTPFIVGYPNPNVVFQSFSGTSGISKVDLQWETSKEAGLKGYYITRSLDEFGPYSRDSDLIPAKGDATIGGIYSYSDTELANGTTYWYKLEMIDVLNVSVGFHGPISISTYSMVPTATEISPASTLAGGIALSFTVTGTNFIPSSKVRWDGSDLDTSYISNTQLTAVIPSSLIQYAGTHQVTVYNPSPGGGISTIVIFTVNNPVPTISSIDPNEKNALSGDFTLTVEGSKLDGSLNFVCIPANDAKSSKILWAGSSSGITVTSCSSTKLIATIPSDKLKTSGVFYITVFNPYPGGGTSNSLSFTVIAATRTVTRTPTPYRTNTSVYRSPTPYRTRTPYYTRTKTRTITPSITGSRFPTTTLSITPGTSTPSQSTLTTQTPEGSTPVPATSTLAPGEPTYTPEPTSQGGETSQTDIGVWRLQSILRILAGILVGGMLFSIPAYLIYTYKTRI